MARWIPLVLHGVIFLTCFGSAYYYRSLGIWSGHTIKHLFGAKELWYAMKIMDGWHPVQEH